MKARTDRNTAKERMTSGQASKEGSVPCVRGILREGKGGERGGADGGIKQADVASVVFYTLGLLL